MILLDTYFKSWNERNLQKLSEIVDDHINLVDWEINVQGKKNFLDANKSIFTKNPNIKAIVVSIHASENQSFAKLKIKVNNSLLDVIDYFEIKDGKISKIKAYRCF
jgi:3-dehydroquinate dehydratase